MNSFFLDLCLENISSINVVNFPQIPIASLFGSVHRRERTLIGCFENMISM